VVVGADGMHSLVARAVDAPVYAARPALTCYYASYWSGMPLDGLSIHMCDRQVSFVFPTHDALTCVAIGWPHQEFQRLRADVEGGFWAALDRFPALAATVRAGRRE